MGSGEKINLAHFTDENDSKSKLIFVLGKNKWADEWGENWNSMKFTLNDYDINEDKTMLFKSYNLNKFDREESIQEVLIDFQNFCQENNMTFNVKNKFL